MANSIAGARVVSGTLTANQVDFIYLAAPSQGIEVMNINGAAPIYFTVSHPGGTAPIPTVAGSVGVYTCPSVAGNYIQVRHDGMYGSIVQLISNGAAAYQVSVTSRNARV